MNSSFTSKMNTISEKLVNDITSFYKNTAIHGYIFGSIARGTNDALSDIDIWFTFNDEDIQSAIDNRLAAYSTFGEIVLLHELQNNFPLNGIQSAILYKIDSELIRADIYLCPRSNSRVRSGSKILFGNVKIAEGEIIPETKRTPREFSDRVSFLISMCFIGIKKVIRNNTDFINFLVTSIKSNGNEISGTSLLVPECNFETLKQSLDLLETVSNSEQKNAIVEIRNFLSKAE